MKIILDNCNSTPLSSYLKSLGVFRILSTQYNKDILAYWESDNFVIESSSLNKEELLNFILSKYKPSSIISPWINMSSIYLHRPNHWNNNGAYNLIMKTDDLRFKQIKNDMVDLSKIEAFSYLYKTPKEFVKEFEKDFNILNVDEKNRGKIRSSLESVSNDNETNAISELYQTNENIKRLVDYYEKNIVNKIDIRAKSRALLSDTFVDWIDSCVVLDSNLKKINTPLLGTGGNEGDMDYATKFQTYIVDMLIKKDHSKDLLESALFNLKPNNNLKKDKIGKFYPARSGGYNQGNSIESKDFTMNPWDFILLIEGLLIWSNSISKKDSLNQKNYLMSPFTVKLSPVGYTSSHIKDPSASKSFETWIPIWKNPAHLEEISSLFKIGRVVFNNKAARNGIEFIEAIKTLGVDKGPTSFIRYVTSVRRGDKNFLAIPVSIMPIDYDKKISSLSEINRMTGVFKRLKPKIESATYNNILDNILRSTYNFSIQDSSTNAQKLLTSLGLAESFVWKNKDGYSKGLSKPIGLLSSKWILYANDNSPEFRIALAVASVTGSIGSIRQDIEPIDSTGNKWLDSNLVWIPSWIGINLYEKMANTVYRRLIKAEQSESKKIPLQGKFYATLEDVSKYIDGLLDENKIENLILGLLLIDWNKINYYDIKKEIAEPSKINYKINRGYLILKASLLNDKDEDSSNIIESRLIPLLKANRINDAIKVAERRVLIKNLLYTDIDFPNSDDGIKLAGALLIPIDADNKNGCINRKIYCMIYGDKKVLRNE